MSAEDHLAIIQRNKALLSAPFWLIHPTHVALADELAISRVSVREWGAYQSWALALQTEVDSRVFFESRLAPQDIDLSIMIFMPKSKVLLEDILAQLSYLMSPGTSVYLVGAQREGIKSANKTMSQYCDAVSKVDSARHCVIWRGDLRNKRQEVCTGDGLDPMTQPSKAPHLTVQVPITVKISDPLALNSAQLSSPVCYEVITLPGVFSHGKLDKGTELLLTSIDEVPSGRVLDFACGCGVVGAFLKRCNPSIDITLCDHDAGAIAATEMTMNGLKKSGPDHASDVDSVEKRGDVDIVPSDGWSEIKGRFHAIYSNPPFHQGVKTDYSVVEQFVKEAKARLHKGGTLTLVANAHLKYGDLLSSVFSQWDIINANNQFKVYKARHA